MGAIRAAAAVVVTTLQEAAAILAVAVLLLQAAVIHQEVGVIRQAMEAILLEVGAAPYKQRSQVAVGLEVPRLSRPAKRDMMSALPRISLI